MVKLWTKTIDRFYCLHSDPSGWFAQSFIQCSTIKQADSTRRKNAKLFLNTFLLQSHSKPSCSPDLSDSPYFVSQSPPFQTVHSHLVAHALFTSSPSSVILCPLRVSYPLVLFDPSENGMEREARGGDDTEWPAHSPIPSMIYAIVLSFSLLETVQPAPSNHQYTWVAWDEIFIVLYGIKNYDSLIGRSHMNA